MDQQNTTAADQGTAAAATAPTDQATAANGEVAAVTIFATKDEAQAAIPKDAAKGTRPYEVSKGGVVLGWMNTPGYAPGLAALAKRDGYALSTGGKTAPVTKEAVASKLAEFTDAELAALGLSRKPQKGGKK
jgi:hypothetical protein